MHVNINKHFECLLWCGERLHINSISDLILQEELLTFDCDYKSKNKLIFLSFFICQFSFCSPVAHSNNKTNGCANLFDAFVYIWYTTHEWWLSTKYFLLLKNFGMHQQSIRNDSVRGGRGTIQQNGRCWNIGQQITPCWLLSKNSSIGYLFFRCFGAVGVGERAKGWQLKRMPKALQHIDIIKLMFFLSAFFNMRKLKLMKLNWNLIWNLHSHTYWGPMS